MGVLNVTPDSFADGGEHFDPDRAIDAALAMARDGADLIDIGAESTRPGAEPLPAGDEWRRLEPVLRGLKGRVDVPISIDTYKAETAARAIELGAAMVNDISALAYDPALAEVVRQTGAPLILMHTRGRSREMYELAKYRDVGAEVASELQARLTIAETLGVPRAQLLVDPGLGFAKKAEHSMAALAALPALASLGAPIVSGPSRKSFLTSAIGQVPPRERVWATAAAVTASIMLGAHIVRVHDVAQMVQVARTTDAIVQP
jgi:dihydropteroate synthase